MAPLLTIGALAGHGDVIGVAPLSILLAIALLFHCIAAALDRGG